jgi:hypothetical protein
MKESERRSLCKLALYFNLSSKCEEERADSDLGNVTVRNYFMRREFVLSENLQPVSEEMLVQLSTYNLGQSVKTTSH